ncbi:MAG: hypothetical protein RMJ98_08980, partial [Myxococcales bacterium]|nr:hypothetical protein [Polyangiaceae bacterium]MDW8249419.1 hypothetical protein [Myxococcales bacterium]
KDQLAARIRAQFPEIDACLDTKETRKRLDHVLHFAVDNKLQISTPQIFLGESFTRICNEDTDLGLRYTLNVLAPRLAEPSP